MTTYNLRNIAAAAVIGIFTISGVQIVSAQSDRDQQKMERKAAKQQLKMDRQRAKLERQRQMSWAKREAEINRYRPTGISNYDVNSPYARYRVVRSGSNYMTDSRGAMLLREAVNQGYREGFNAGRSETNGNRDNSWSNLPTYRTGTMGYQSYVDRGQYQYYFRQGFQRGYQDGTNVQYRDDMNGTYQYGAYENGSLNILGSILNSILNLQTY
jgi:hypothetical protein